MTEHSLSDENEELRRLNDELLKRRATAKAEAMKLHGDSLAAIKALLAKGDSESARRLGIELRGTMLFEEVVPLFKKAPATFHCTVCGMENIEGLAFKKETLSWIRPSVCDACVEKKKEMDKARQVKLFDKFIEQNMHEILEVVGVTGRLLNGSYEYEGFIPEVIQACKRCAMGKHGLYIDGGVGRGKSCLAVAIMKDVIQQASKHPIEMQKQLMSSIGNFRELYRFVLVPSLLETMRATYRNEDFQGVQRVLDEYSTLHLLILDDIGAEKPSAWVLEKLTSIVDFRNNRELKTLYTSNKNLDELTEHLDERITSRIRQQCDIIHLTGPDRRRL